MATLKDIMQKDVITVEPELTLRDLVALLTHNGITGAPVVANGRVLGVVSTTDVLELDEATPGVPVEREPVTDDSEWMQAETWQAGDESPSVYFSQLWEPQEADVLERFETPDQPEWDVLEQHTVGEVMSRRIISLGPEASIREAARVMLNGDIHRILVIGEDGLEGIVTTTDIVRAVAEGQL